MTYLAAYGSLATQIVGAMERLYGDALVKSEVAQASGFAGIEQTPFDRRNARLGAQRKPVKADRLRNEGCIHSCD